MRGKGTRILILPISFIFPVVELFTFMWEPFLCKAVGHLWLWSLCLFQVNLNTIRISVSLSHVTRPEKPGTVDASVFLKIPVARFLLELLDIEKFTFFGLWSHSPSVAHENRIYLQVNLNEPCRVSRRGSFSGQLGGVMWNASPPSTSAFCYKAAAGTHCVNILNHKWRG